MHIEPGIVDGAKIALSYATGAASLGLVARLAAQSLRNEGSLGIFALRSAAATALVFGFFEILPHQAAGVSEVHLILGSTLFLIFGAGPAAIGLALGLLIQGLFFAPFDLPQFGMNITTLIVPLYALTLLAKRVIPARTAYADLKYGQALALSTAFQGGIVAWVAFWAIYGRGFAAENVMSVVSFGAAYMLVLLVEPLVDLAVIAAAKSLGKAHDTGLVRSRVYRAAA